MKTISEQIARVYQLMNLPPLTIDDVTARINGLWPVAERRLLSTERPTASPFRVEYNVSNSIKAQVYRSEPTRIYVFEITGQATHLACRIVRDLLSDAGIPAAVVNTGAKEEQGARWAVDIDNIL